MMRKKEKKERKKKRKRKEKKREKCFLRKKKIGKSTEFTL